MLLAGWPGAVAVDMSAMDDASSTKYTSRPSARSAFGSSRPRPPVVAQARRVAKMLQPPSAAEVRELVASAPVWLASASRIGDTVGVLAHKIWISLVEWCDGRTLHGATLEVSPREIMPVEITRDRSSVNKSLGPYPHAN